MLWRFISVDPSKILQRAKDRVPNLVGVKHTSKEVRKVYNSSLVDPSRFQVLMGTEAVRMNFEKKTLMIIEASETLITFELSIKYQILKYILKIFFYIIVFFLSFKLRNSYLIFLSALIFRWHCHIWEHYSTNWRRLMILGTKTQHWIFK